MRNLTYHTTPFLLILALILSIGQPSEANAQSQDAYSAFMALETAEERFDLFFTKQQKYTGVSAYRWKENIETIIKRINIAEDPISRPYYETMLCQIYEDIGSYEKGAYLADKLLADEANLDLKVKRQLLKVADRIYSEMQLFQKQLEVRKAQERLGEKVELYTVYADLGLYRQALIDYEIRNPKQEVMKAGVIRLARYYKDRADFKRLDGRLTLTAVKEYEEALSLIEEYINTQGVNDPEEFQEALFLRGQILGGIGRCLLVQGRHLEAIPYLEQGVSSGKRFEKGKYPYHAVGYWTDLAESYLKVDRLEMSKLYLDSVAQAGPLAPSTKIRYYHLKADHFLEAGDVKNAATYLAKYSKGSDSLEKSVMGKQLLGQFVAFDIDQQTKRVLEKQRMDLERNENELIERDKIIYLSIVALLFSLLCVVALIVAYMKSVKNKRLIEDQKQIIESSLVEKDSLLKEIHHRVKNNLQMVSSLMSLQSKNTRSQAAINALKEGQSRVRAMALIHQKLYQNDDLSVIWMQEYIESLIASIQSVFKKEGYDITIHIDAEKTELDVDRAIPIGLILNELVSNSYKYAFAENKKGNINITLHKDGEHYKFEYRDDGKGLPADFEQTSKGSMGLRLIKRLANQLRSELAIDTQAKGAHFWFNFG
ncbi:sensor histidine kinase [Robertkochia sediminum]|uniref:sensor histidine kinase n=1 Tax=Robertkochia sediminum TaxID=2785326 RepID=UPI001931D030|nr:sensor histidine kinase [Robertkochia sediminum]MBL7473396.1 sensor histidine kinase [Robertkochia sediminum]